MQNFSDLVQRNMFKFGVERRGVGIEKCAFYGKLTISVTVYTAKPW